MTRWNILLHKSVLEYVTPGLSVWEYPELRILRYSNRPVASAPVREEVG